jgi:organic hydroperoxide reductase OsmC/OhrA
MAQHEARIQWRRAASERYTDRQYSRAHTWKFDGGATVAASSSPHNVKVPLSKPENVDPEEALVAALSSCHMLVFLAEAAAADLVVDSYDDAAVGFMGEFELGKPAVTKVVLRPQVRFSGTKAPTEQDIDRLHHRAHEACFIANSVKSEVVVEGGWTHGASPLLG